MNLFLLPSRKNLPFEPTHFPLDTFPKEVRPILQILAEILGREDKTIIDEAILGIFSLMMNPEMIFDIPTFWERMVNSQLLDLSLT